MSNITISIEEYNDFCMMRDYIYDNNHVMSFEMYVDIKKGIENHNEYVNRLSNE